MHNWGVRFVANISIIFNKSTDLCFVAFVNPIDFNYELRINHYALNKGGFYADNCDNNISCSYNRLSDI